MRVNPLLMPFSDQPTKGVGRIPCRSPLVSLGSWALLAAWLCLSAILRVEVRAEIRTGADYLVADEASPLRGKRVALA